MLNKIDDLPLPTASAPLVIYPSFSTPIIAATHRLFHTLIDVAVAADRESEFLERASGGAERGRFIGTSNVNRAMAEQTNVSLPRTFGASLRL
jgi:hypothetical protein